MILAAVVFFVCAVLAFVDAVTYDREVMALVSVAFSCACAICIVWALEQAVIG